MISTLLFDFSRVLLDVKDKNYTGLLNDLHRKKSKHPDYNFFDYFGLNVELLNFLDQLKGKYPLYIFTSGSVQNVPVVRKRLDQIFRKIYSSEELGLNKKDPQSYLIIAKDLNKNPNEILFTDDQLENIQAAEAANLLTIHFDSNRQFINEIPQFVII